MNTESIEYPHIGKKNKLRVLRYVDFGLYLDGGDLDEILLPKKFILKNYKIGDEIEVFLYTDSEDRLVATTLEPHAFVGDFAYLKVVSTSSIGAFMDLGLEKDLLVPFREQAEKMIEGESYLVFVYLDPVTERIVASSRLNRFVKQKGVYIQAGQEVDLLIANKTDLGYNAIVNNSHWGLLHFNDIFKEICLGQKMTGFIRRKREDDKIDLALEPIGYQKMDLLANRILEKLKNEAGWIPTTDYTNPEVIYKIYKMSKKNYKKAVGLLKKQKLISLEDKGIRLLKFE